ncbi:MAG: RHS repeat-associated core domain-containing protein [Prolixibacteraceae bacterium]|nr:RHS repeat-associated core domain-containing protein [Prolixibacteraceae bacterium]MBN2650377.1 RHS repeat-associated core domain-containing protein [Prolixibacteraceae bacterium]
MNKTIYLFILLLLYSYMAIAQGVPGDVPTPVTSGQDLTAQPTQNYIRTYKYKVANSPSLTDPSEVNIDITYFDGLGRSSQIVSVMASPTGKDIVTPIAYDNYGRQEKKYLPFAKSVASNNGKYTTLTDAISQQKIFLNGIYGSTDKNYGYSETDFDDSPLNRVIRESSPGAAWRMNGGHEVELNYTTNTSTVTGYRYVGNNYVQISYAAGKLYITNKTDENGNTVKEYTDFEGKVIQEVNAASKTTRYCYDDFGLLRCVIQPKTSSPSTTELCFYYKYDERKRMTDKKIPGAGWVYLIYDNRDRLVATQDANQRAKSPDEWSYFTYDNLNRIKSEGIFTTNSTRSTVEDDLVDGTITNYASKIRQKLNYYDNYPSYCSTYTPFYENDADFMDVEKVDNLNGLITTIHQTPLEDVGTQGNSVITTMYYDKYGRVIQNVTCNHMEGLDIVTNKYSFDGVVIQSRHRHSSYYGSTDYTVIDYFYEYDHRGRLLKTRMKIDNGLETIVSANKYDEAGQLSKKWIHSQNNGSFLQRSDYKYNIRGWLTQIDDPDNFDTGDVFGLKLFYNSTPTGGTASYNGNISAVKWNTNDSLNYQYLYSYDNVDRLHKADFSGDGYNSNSFDCFYTYDDNGNIRHVRRRGYIGGLIDFLGYDYIGNKVVKVTDDKSIYTSSDNYAGSNSIFQYDDNGNLIYEPNKGNAGVALEYNQLNLPEEVDFGLNNEIHYFYTVDGTKLRQEVETSAGVVTTDYVGPFIYETSGGTRSLKYIQMPEGLYNNSTAKFEYHMKDHLGNVRVVLAQDGVIKQTTDYYPYGMRITPLCTSNSDNPYLYNGKEMQNELGLDWYDYGARFYDPALGRWHSVDPLAEDYYSHSPYTYVENNPLIYIDPDGMAKWKFHVSLKWGSTGAVGAKVKFVGVPVGYKKSNGGTRYSASVYFEVDTDKGTAKLGLQKRKTIIEKEESVNFGLVQSSNSSTQEKVWDWNTEDGGKGDENKDEKTFKDKETSGVPILSVEETDEGETLKIEIESGVEVGAGPVGEGGIEFGIEATDEEFLNNK